MSSSISPAMLNQKCMPYPEVFSHHRKAQSIQLNSFPVTKRGAAEKCHDVSEWLQKGSRCSLVHNGEDPIIVQNQRKLSKEQVAYYSTLQGTIDLNKKGINLAVEKRIALFLQQAILCYGMSQFTFSVSGADSQIGQAPSMRLSAPKQAYTIHKREAAHSSTIPTLIAHAKDGSTPNGFVYLKGGLSYYQHNATIGMHEWVNGADELIDGKKKDGKLRDTTVKTLNLVAQGLDPVEATKKFCSDFKDQVCRIAKSLDPDDGRKVVLDLYARKIEKIQQAAADPSLFDKLIGVIIDPSNPHEKILRKVVYQKRYDVIQLQEVIESRIGKRIAEVQKKMPSHEKSFLEYMILTEFSNTSEKKVLEKLFCKSTAYFEDEYQSNSKFLKAFKTRIHNLKVKHRSILNPLMRDLRADFRELSCAEFTYRAGVFKDLRTKVHHWTQEDFCSHYLKTTQNSVSQSWVSRMEQLSRIHTKATYHTPITQRRRYVTIEDGKRCAETFGVDPGIFFPCLFTS